MNFFEYLKEKISFIIINLGMLILSSALLIALNTYMYAVVLVFVINLSGIILYYVYDYYNKNSYYNKLLNSFDEIDKKYLISEVIEEPEFIEGRILYNIIKQTNKAMNDEIFKIKRNMHEYREYIELWVHEIKTPIASSKLIIENNKSELTESLKEEIDKVENFIEQALFYARSSNIEDDYIIKKINIGKCINNVIKRNADILIKRKIKIDISDVNKIVFCDSKWIEFIINQIISNSIKYMDNEENIIKIYCKEVNKNIVLYICDNGIGMSENSVQKAFKKGYTGENGRIYTKSTGIGLYLCKKLCDKLGILIKLESERYKWTIVSLIFPVNEFMKIN